MTFPLSLWNTNGNSKIACFENDGFAVPSRYFQVPADVCILHRSWVIGQNLPTAKVGECGFYRPPKTNMEPENESVEEEIPFGKHRFEGPC